MKNDNFRENVIPQGVTDFLPDQAESLSYIESQLNRVFELWGFRKIIPPLLEFEDILATGMDDSLRDKSFRFEDRHSHRMLAIPPDVTPQVARIEAMRMAGYPLPHRLYYNSKVLRHVQSQSGRSREVFQAGVELIGLDSPEADAEMIAMSAEVLRELGFTGFKIALGQVEFFHGIMAASGIHGTAALNLQQAICRKDLSSVRTALESLAIPETVKGEMLALPRMFGGTEVLELAAASVHNDRSRKALDNLAQVVEILSLHGLREELTIDLGEIRGLAYHSGITFEAFVPGIGEPVCGGGRYDGLMARYGRDLPATGFAFNLLSLLQGMEKDSCRVGRDKRAVLVFNQKPDRKDALAISARLRRQGFAVTRDIIRRDLEESLNYSRRMNIDYLALVSAGATADGQVLLQRIADGRQKTVTIEALLQTDAEHIFAEWPLPEG